ncbi:hypothetical protein QX233_23175, partial [Chryseobacterium gambrini]
ALVLPAGASSVLVGAANIQVQVEPFTHNFESGRLDGWVVNGDAFRDSAARFRLGLPMRGFDGQVFIFSGVRSHHER